MSDMAEYTDVTVDLTCDNNAFIESGNPTTNYGNPTFLEIGFLTTSPARRRSLVHFPQLSIPADVDEIISAIVYLYEWNHFSGTPDEVWCDLLLSEKAWEETGGQGVTWNYPWGTPGGDFGSNPWLLL